MSNRFKELILTNHALERMKERGIFLDQIYTTYKNPDSQGRSKNGGKEYVKRFGEYQVTIIFKHNERNESIVVSAWMDPPLPGTKDYKQKERWKEYQKAGFKKKLWLTLLRQLGM